MTDPPYNIPIDGFVGGKGSVKHREFAHASGEMSDAEFLAFLAAFFTTAMTTLIPGALVYAWMDWRHIDTLIAAGKQSGLSLLNLCVWAKTTAGMGSLYRSQHELCAVFKFGDEPHVNNVELGKHGRSDPICGPPAAWRALAASAMSFRSTQLLSPSACSPTPSLMPRSAAIRCWIRSWAAARHCSPATRSAGTASASRLIPCMSMLPSGAGRGPPAATSGSVKRAASLMRAAGLLFR